MTYKKDTPKSSKATPRKPDAPSKARIYRGIPLVGKSELEKLGIDTSDEYIISLGQKKRPYTADPEDVET